MIVLLYRMVEGNKVNRKESILSWMDRLEARCEKKTKKRRMVMQCGMLYKCSGTV